MTSSPASGKPGIWRCRRFPDGGRSSSCAPAAGWPRSLQRHGTARTRVIGRLMRLTDADGSSTTAPCGAPRSIWRSAACRCSDGAMTGLEESVTGMDSAAEAFDIGWCRDQAMAPALARFFVAHAPPAYISHAELQGGRAEDPGRWAEDLERRIVVDVLRCIGRGMTRPRLRAARSSAGAASWPASLSSASCLRCGGPMRCWRIS